MARKKTKKTEKNNNELKQWIWIVIITAITVIAYSEMGIVGIILNNLQRFLFGNLYYVIMILFVVQLVVSIVNKRSGYTSSKNPIAILLMTIGILLISSYLDSDKTLYGFEILSKYVNSVDFRNILNADFIGEKSGGGLFGAFLLSGSTYLVDYSGTIVVIVSIFLVALLLLINLEVYKQFGRKIKEYFTTPANIEEELEPFEDEPLLPSEAKTNKEMTIDLKDIEKVDEDKAVLDIKADEITEPYVKETPLSSSTSHAFFMNIDDLMDAQEEEKQPEEEVLEEDIQEAVEENNDSQSSHQVETAVKKQYHLPRLNLLDPLAPKSSDEANVKAAKEKGEALIQVLNNFEIKAELIDTHIGPSVTKYEIRPEVGVKVAKIISLADDIKMQLAVKDVRIEAPIPGHNAVGIEIPNVKANPVKMKELVNKENSEDKGSPLLIYLGKDLLGRAVTCRLDKMPHLLIAGATGSGKSVCMNSIIISLLLRNKPDDVKILLIDPKKVEFTPYQNIPHLIGPVINDSQKASNGLKVIVNIMEERYEIFSKNSVRNIQAYNELVKKEPERTDLKKMPYIVVIIDELADLMAVSGKEVEGSIQRITQLARAAGIHLIVATQRPSTDVITGIIKANIPSRIAFSVSSGIDSRTILDHTGAERLLGNGDMLYLPIGESSPTRVQGVYVSDDEVKRITEYVSNQQKPLYNDAFLRLEGVEGNSDTAIMTIDNDPLYEEIKNYVIENQKASTSLLQRRFGIGYNRAAKFIDYLESQGIIGPAQGSKPRDVLVKKDSNKE